MIVVCLESWPAGDRARRRPIGTARIIADGSGDRDTGHYLFEIDNDGTGQKPVGDPWRTGRVFDFPRRQRGAWDLLFRALAATLADRSAGCASAAAIEASRGACALGGLAGERAVVPPGYPAGETAPDPHARPGRGSGSR